jgi:HSP20 family protein
MQRQNNPFDDLERMFERMAEQFDDAGWLGEEGRPGGGTRPATDVLDRGDEVVVTVDVPGFDREDLDIRVSDGTLRVAAEHSEESEEDSGDYVRRERRRTSMSRSVQIPAEVDTGGASASLQGGVLTVTLPKADHDETRTIDIS